MRQYYVNLYCQLSAYRVLFTQATLKQIHRKNPYLNLDTPDDEVLGVLEACVVAAEHRNLEEDIFWKFLKESV